MIPVVTMDNAGKLNYQVFNDNLTPVEQINRKTLAAVSYAQLKLVDDRDAFSRKMNSVQYTDAQLDTINTAAETLFKAIKSACDTFAAAL